MHSGLDPRCHGDSDLKDFMVVHQHKGQTNRENVSLRVDRDQHLATSTILPSIHQMLESDAVARGTLP